MSPAAVKDKRSRTVDFDSLRYVLAPGTKLVRRPVPGFADVVRESAQVERKDYGLYQTISITGPLPIGQRVGNDVHRCYDQDGVIAWFPGQLTRGPQEQSPTWSGPTTFKVQPGAGYVEAFGILFMYGDATAADGEPIWYFVGSTTTWTDATFNADVTGDVTRIVGMVLKGATLYAVGNALVSNGANNKSLYQTTTGTAWAESVGAVNETIGIGDRLVFLLDGDLISTTGWASTPTILSLGWTNGGATLRPVYKNAVTDAAWAASNLGSISDDLEPRGFVIFPGPDGANDLFVSTHKGLYYYNVSTAAVAPQRVVAYRNPRGTHTGKLTVSGDRIWFADGPNVGSFRWLSSTGDHKAEWYGPEWRSDRPLWSGMVLEKLGDVTALTYDRLADVLWVAKGGLAASRNATVLRFDVPALEWYVPYMNGTAQRAVMGLFMSLEDDGTERLHWNKESAAGGDQDPRFFANINVNPLELSTYAYNASGTILDSERKPLGGLAQVGWRAIQVDADSLSATKKVTIRDGQDGTAPANSQDVTSSTSPAQVWPDKTDGTAGVGVGAKRQQIEFDILDNAANTTVGPTVKEITITFVVKGLLPDATLPEEFEFVVDLNATAKSYGTYRGNPKNVLQSLQATCQKMTLVPIILDGGETVQVEPVMADAALDPQIANAVQQAPMGGTQIIRSRQSLR